MNDKRNLLKRSRRSFDLTKKPMSQEERAEMKRRAYEALPAIADAAWGRVPSKREETYLYTVTISGSRSQIISLPLSAFLTEQSTEEEKSVGK